MLHCFKYPACFITDTSNSVTPLKANFAQADVESSHEELIL